MNGWRKALAFGAVATLCAVGLGVGQVSAGRQTAHVVSMARTLGPGAPESKFVPITPCRIYDTRKIGHPIPAGSFRPVKIRQPEDFSGQFAALGGKPGGCGIPSDAEAIEATVTAVTPAGAGFLRIYPALQAAPTATFLNYGTQNIGNTGAISICSVGCPQGDDVNVAAFSHATDVVIDLQGYFDPSNTIAAEISSSGTILHGSHVSGVTKLNTGSYSVLFDQDVSACTYQATVSTATPNSTTIGAEFEVGNNNRVDVNIVNGASTFVDRQFSLDLTC